MLIAQKKERFAILWERVYKNETSLPITFMKGKKHNNKNNKLYKSTDAKWKDSILDLTWCFIVSD